MITPRPQDAIHKVHLYRILMALADDIELMNVLGFKGGTCATLLGRLDRFSVDLDFDLLASSATSAVKNTKEQGRLVAMVREHLGDHFRRLGLSVKDSSKKGIQYFLRYDAPANQRNTIKVEVSFPPPKSNEYTPEHLRDIDRTMRCQTVETMVANKLVAVLDRWEKHHSIAGRDVYDIHHFLTKGYRYNDQVIVERHSTTVEKFFEELIAFIEKHITSTTLQQDLNPLLPQDVLRRLLKTLKQETLVLLKDELTRLATRS